MFPINRQFVLFIRKNVGDYRKFCLAINTTDKASHVTGEQKFPATENYGKQALVIGVIGMPNAGKSTFINNLINHRVCPTSCKVHTTRNVNKAVVTSGKTQLVFCDTPGLVTQQEMKKHNLEKAYKSACRSALRDADLIAVIHDASNAWTRNALHWTVIDTLKAFSSVPSILVLNKTDAIKSKRVLLNLVKTLTNDTLRGNRREKEILPKLVKKDEAAAEDCEQKQEGSWSHFSEVFMVSSITGNGLNDVNNYLMTSAKPKAWQFSKELFTDMAPQTLIEECVRARLLDYLPQEIPYNLQSVVEYFSDESNVIYASVLVICPSKRIDRLICGKDNGRLKQITDRVISDLVATFRKAVSITISTRTKNSSST